MENEFVMPDLGKLSGKELKKEKIKVDKIYGPFLMHFLGNNGIFTIALKRLHNMLITRFTRLIEIVEKVYGEAEDGNKRDKKNEEPGSEKKKKSWINEKWQKVIKNGFFQKTLGLLKGLASVSFITELLMFIVLLRMGIIQKFLPWIAAIIGDGIKALIDFLPQLLAMFWKLLWVTIPGILKKIFRSILDMFGLDNPMWGKITDVIAQFLPLLLAIVWAVSFLTPVVTFLISAFATIGTILSVIGTIISLIFSPIGLIIAAIILVGVLVWKFREEIWDFMKWIGRIFYKYFIKPWVIIGKIFYKLLILPIISGFKWAAEMLYTYLITPIMDAFKWLAGKIFQYVISPIANLFKKISRMAAPVIKKMGPVMDMVGDFFNFVSTKVSSMISSISKTFQAFLDMFTNIATYGWEYFTMSEGKKKAIQTVQKNVHDDSLLYRAGESEAAYDELKAIAKSRPKDAGVQATLKTVEGYRNRANKELTIEQWMAESMHTEKFSTVGKQTMYHAMNFNMNNTSATYATTGTSSK